MKIRSIAAVMLGAILLLGLLEGAHAANPADLTSLWRIYPPFYQVEADTDGSFLYISQPISENLSLELYDRHESTNYLHEFGVTARVSGKLQLGIVSDRSKNTEAVELLMADYQNGKLGLGLVAPLDRDKKVQYGPRLIIGKTLTAYATLVKNQDPIVGLSYNKAGNCVSAACFEKTWWLRYSKKMGHWIPEFRYKNTAGKDNIGFSIAWTP